MLEIASTIILSKSKLFVKIYPAAARRSFVSFIVKQRAMANIQKEPIFLILFFHNPLIAYINNIHTATLIPFKACWTISKSEKLEINPAIKLIIINDGSIMLDGHPLKVMEYDKILNRLGIEIPFEIELSIKLKLYGLIDELIPNTIGVADTLWQ